MAPDTREQNSKQVAQDDDAGKKTGRECAATHRRLMDAGFLDLTAGRRALWVTGLRAVCQLWQAMHRHGAPKSRFSGGSRCAIGIKRLGRLAAHLFMCNSKPG